MTEPSAKVVPWPWWAWVAIGLAGVTLLVLGGIFPEADPPGWLPGGLPRDRIDEFLVEAPAKAHEARNWALFGEWHRNPADNYQFWRAQAPVWVYPLAWTFKVFGVSYTTLRWFSLAIGMAGFVGFVVVARRLLPAWASVAAAWLYATNAFVVLVARSGLIEVLMNTMAAWMVACLLVARRHPLWLVLSQVAFAVGFFGKQGFLYLFPLLVFANIAAFVQWNRRGEFQRLRWLPVATAAVIAALSVAIMLQPAYVRALTWNWDHMVSGVDQTDRVYWWYRFDAQRIWLSTQVMTPFIGLLGLPGALWLGWVAWRERRFPWDEAVLLGWCASAAIAATVARDWTVRTNSILLMPSLIIAVLVSVRLMAIPRAHLGIFVAALGLASLGTNTSSQIRLLQETSYGLRNGVAQMDRVIGNRRAVMIGRFAMPMVLGTRYDAYYVKGPFNSTVEQLEALDPTYLILSSSESTPKLLKSLKPEWLKGKKLTTFRVNRRRMSLSLLPRGPRVAEPPADVGEPLPDVPPPEPEAQPADAEAEDSGGELAPSEEE